MLNLLPVHAIEIRCEHEDDYPAIHELVKTAFKTAYYAEGDEQDFIDRRRNDGEYLSALALVMESQKRMIGHLIMTQNGLDCDGLQQEILLLAAVCIQQEYRNQGLGTQLVGFAIDHAKSLGHKAIILAGDPQFYTRFGFRSAIEFGIQNANGIDNTNVLALELVPEALQGCQGIFTFPL